MKYTQREWDRVVGYGKVPEQYRHVSDRKTDGQDSTRGNKTREEVKRTVEKSKTMQGDMDGRTAERKPIKSHYIP